jgi:hypothetical protein
MSRSMLRHPYVLGLPYVGSTFCQVDIVSGRHFVSQLLARVKHTTSLLCQDAIVRFIQLFPELTVLTSEERITEN